MTLRGAELIVEFLERHGVEIVAGMPGGAVLPLYEALGGSTRIRHVLARHEQSAGFIAQGMARVTGRAGVCIVTSGPGATNVVTALADAKLDSVPLVCLAGQVPTRLIGTDAFQEVATLEMVRPVTKARYFVETAEALPEILAEAFRVAEGGRPGPVLIDLPKDVQTQIVARESSARRGPSGPRQPAPQQTHGSLVSAGAGAAAVRDSVLASADKTLAYDRAAALIAAAERPLLYLGGGVILARAQTLACRLAGRCGIPVATSLMALGVLPPGDELYLGMLGMHGARYTNHAVDEADLLVAIGARFDDRATGDPRSFAHKARIIHIDIDSRELGKIKQPTLAIADDAANALRELLHRLEGLPAASFRGRREWHARIGELKRSHPLRTPRSDVVCSPYGIMRALGEALPDGVTVTTDVGQHQMWAAQALPLRPGTRWLTSGGLGTMGFGLPAAIGAALTSPGSPVACITGDGSLLINLQELATLAELDLDVKIIMLDNAGFGLVRQQQELFHRKRFVGSRFRQGTDFVAVAAAFGIPATDLGQVREPARTLERIMAGPGPALVRVPIDAAEHVLPLVAPGSANTDPVDHPDSNCLGDVDSSHSRRRTRG